MSETVKVTITDRNGKSVTYIHEDSFREILLDYTVQNLYTGKPVH